MLMAGNTLLLILWLPFLLFLPLVLPLLRKLITKPQKHVPPSPPKLPLIGNLHQFAQSGSSTDQNLWRMSQKYGPVMLLHLGRIPVLVISSAKAAKQTLKDNDLNCCSRPAYTASRRLTYNFQDIAFCPYGDYWKKMRKKCALELFSVNRVQSYRSIREEEAVEMINSISDRCAFSSSNSCVDLTDKLFTFSASIAFRIFFGTSFKGSHFKHDGFHRMIHVVEASLTSFCAADYFPSYIGSIIDRITGKDQEINRVFEEVHGFFQHVIDDHLRPERTKPEHEDIVDVLLKIVKEETEFGTTQLGHNSIKAVLLDLFVGGIETSSITMVWAMVELAKNPRVMKKAQEEVRNCIGNKGKVSETDIEKLGYLKMIVKETLRLHPPGPLLIPRETISHFKVLGYDIDPQTVVYVNYWAISRDPESWKDPENFNPERFDDSSVDFKGQHFEYLPFGAGRRICPGIYMATTSMELALANLLYCFDWKMPHEMKEEDINMEEPSGLSRALKAPLKLVATRYLAC